MSGGKSKKSGTFISSLRLPFLQEPVVAGAAGTERRFFMFGSALSKRGWRVSYIVDNIGCGVGNKTILLVEIASFSFTHGNKRRFVLDYLPILYLMWNAIRNVRFVDVVNEG